VEVSGRKGLGVKADDLMDSLIEKALREVVDRHPDDGEEQNRAVATQIAIAALRYFLLKFTRNTVIAFDLQEALSFEGETGPYVQYSAVRARNILRKWEERGERDPGFRGGVDAVRRWRGSCSSKTSGRCCWPRRRRTRRWRTRSVRASRRMWRGMRSNWRRRSATSIRSTPSFTKKIARRRSFCCG
jgi:hypothetical protein